jgi:hypothetical protein
MNHLRPALNKDMWTPRQDIVLVQQQYIYGDVWSQITQGARKQIRRGTLSGSGRRIYHAT